MGDAQRDNNSIPTLIAVSNVDGVTPVVLYADPVTHRLLVSTSGTNPMSSLGDIIYGGAAGAQTRLAGNTTSTKKFLTQTGNGSISAIPAWDTIIAADIPDISATYALVGQTFYIGTTQVAINRVSAALTLAGITLTAPVFNTSIATGYLTASEIVITDGSKNIVSAPVATYPSLTELSYIKGLTSAIQTQLNGKAATLSGTINEIAYFSSASAIASLAIATYPSLTELSYVKGVTSAIQTQLGTKAPTASPTFTGTTVQSGNIDLDLPASDHTATGNTTNAIQSGATVAAFELVFLGSGGKWLLVDSDAVATCKGLIGIALEAKNDTQAMSVALPGSFVRDDTWAWTVGATLYAGETPGTMQEAIPTGADAIIKVVGFAVTADIVFFNPSPDQQSTVA
jgi:hypothetical protein